MINSWKNLITDSNYTNQSLISGEWFAVRFVPDVIAAEVFNIGVVFIDQEKQAHYKLLDNADAFTCLFGEKGKANISFLLKVVSEVLNNNNYTVTPSPHIQYSQRRTAQGATIDEILNDLYKSMVSLICKNNGKEENIKSPTLSTNALRKTVFGMLKKQYPKTYDRYLVDHPYKISNPSTEQSMVVDMPIRYYNGIRSNVREEYYGTVVSAAYIDPVHRTYNLNYLGVTNVMNCLEILGKGIHSALIIYLPPVDDIKFTQAVYDQADRELEKCLYGLRQMQKEGYQLKLEVEQTPEDCFHQALEFIS